MPRVLIIDGQRHMLDLLTDKFQREGFDVLVAEEGEEGVRCARAERPDLVILNEKLRDAEGKPVRDRFRSQPLLAQIPLILLTTRPPSADDGSEHGPEHVPGHGPGDAGEDFEGGSEDDSEFGPGPDGERGGTAGDVALVQMPFRPKRLIELAREAL